MHAASQGTDGIQELEMHHNAAVRAIGETGLEDLETPHGYGGPVANNVRALQRGISKWRKQQLAAGRVAEFVRLHPFLNPVAYRGIFDRILFNRMTVLVDLRQPVEMRRNYYSKGTKHALRRASKLLKVRRLAEDEWEIFRDCYIAGLSHNRADQMYYFDPIYYRNLLAAPWAVFWVVEMDGKPVAAACFLWSKSIAHYHLSGGLPEHRSLGGQYLLLETAFEHFGRLGCQWMHLGGGRTRALKDSLFRFKAKFSPHRASYFVGGMIFDKEKYDKLGGDRPSAIIGYRSQAQSVYNSTKDNLILRPATEEDFPDFFALRSGVENIVWSGFDRPPEWNELKHWFLDQLDVESGKSIYIASIGPKTVGYAYANYYDDRVETALAVDGSETGNGWGRKIARQLCERLNQETPGRRIEAWIFPENIGSVRAHEAAGYQNDHLQDARAVKVAADIGADKQSCWTWTP